MKKRIFVIDDESDLTYMLKLSLESMGYYTVESENDPANAVRAARAFDPDLIVLDIMMPEQDGSEVASGFKADPLLKHTPVVFMTALVSQEDAPEGSCNSGGQTFLPKDISIDKLMACINAKIGGHQAALAG